jgi:hypothetical protein
MDNVKTLGKMPRPRPALTSSRLQDKKDWLNFVFFQKTKVPKFFRIRKNHLQLLITVVPLTSVIFLFTTLILLVSYEDLQRKFSAPGKAEINTESEEIDTLKGQVAELQTEIERAQKKLATPAAALPLEELLLYKPSIGRKDLRSEQLLAIENMSAGIEREQFTIKFNITNPNAEKGQRVAGHAFALLKTNLALKFYPSASWSDNKQFLLQYNLGESFSAMRLRPFQINFDLTKGETVQQFKILFFNRQGDLIAANDYTPDNIR